MHDAEFRRIGFPLLPALSVLSPVLRLVSTSVDCAGWFGAHRFLVSSACA